MSSCVDRPGTGRFRKRKKQRTESSRRWLKEHHADPFVQEAKAQGWRSRAVFKLKHIQTTDHILKAGQVVVDLGAAPGGWSQYAVRCVKKGGGEVFALDVLPMEPIEGVTFLEGDFTEELVFNRLQALLAGRSVDVVLSDMAPNMSGMVPVDQVRSMYLAELARDFALEVLKKDGIFLVKLFEGSGVDDFMQSLKKAFSKVVRKKPNASRLRSREFYVLAFR